MLCKFETFMPLRRESLWQGHSSQIKIVSSICPFQKLGTRVPKSGL